MFSRSLLAAFAVVTAVVAPAAAQEATSCNPLNSTCPADPALGTTYNETFGESSSLDPNIWNTTAGAVTFEQNGAQYTIAAAGDSVTTQSSFYIFWGKVEVIMQAAAGQGIVSSIVLLSDDLDEIDWEILGGNTTMLETNYFGKGNQSERNAVYVPCSPGPQEAMHNYTTVWTQEQLEWWLDGNLVRTLAFADAPDNSYPQTPSYLKIGNWAGGGPGEPEGTVQWAGGPTDFSKAPFTMVVGSVKVTDYSTNATSYSYKGNSGTFDSVQINKNGPSPQAAIINAPPAETLSQKFNGYSEGVKIAIIAAPSAIGLALLALGLFCCFKQRALGRRERAIEDAQYEKHTAEILAYRRRVATSMFGGVGVGPSHGAYQQLHH